MERQRLAEWEETRKEELKQHRMREQEKVLTLKAKQEHMTNDLETLREKVKVYICCSPHTKSVIIYKDCHHFSHNATFGSYT